MRFFYYNKFGLILFTVFLTFVNTVAPCMAAEKMTCYHNDVSGNIVAVTDGSGLAVTKYVYSAYGKMLSENTASDNPYNFSGSFGIAAELPELYFMRARYYSVDACRFLSTDPIKYVGPGWKPDLFLYPRNPMRFSDPEGEEILLTAVVIYFAAITIYGWADAFYDSITTKSIGPLYRESWEMFLGVGTFGIPTITGANEDWNNNQSLAGGIKKLLSPSESAVLYATHDELKEKYGKEDGDLYMNYDNLKTQSEHSKTNLQKTESALKKDTNTNKAVDDAINAVNYAQEKNLAYSDEPTTIQGNIGTGTTYLTETETKTVTKKKPLTVQDVWNKFKSIF